MSYSKTLFDAYIILADMFGHDLALENSPDINPQKAGRTCTKLVKTTTQRVAKQGVPIFYRQMCP